MDKVLITGVAGFLGSNLADQLIKKGYKIIGVDNLIGGDLDNVDSKVEFYKYDCQDFEKIDKITKGVKWWLFYIFFLDLFK
jgi:UDP-glucose 4-epimerase